MITTPESGDPYVVQPRDSLIHVKRSPVSIMFGNVGARRQIVVVRDRTMGSNGDIHVQVPGLGYFHLTNGEALAVGWDELTQSWHI